MPRGDAAQAALDLPIPGAAELFPPRGKASPGGGFAEFCLQKIRAMLAAPGTSPAAGEWHRGFTARDRAWLCDAAGVGAELAGLKWAEITAADRARLLAAFERFRLWVQMHSEFSVGADVEEYADSIGYRTSR